jgi:hypothetical protein
LNPDHKAKSDGDPFNPLFHDQASISKDLLPITLYVLAPAIARFRVVVYSLAPLSVKLISHRNQAVADGICAFVRLFDPVSHISPLQLSLSTSIAPPINHLLFASGLLSSGSSSHWGFAAAPDVILCESLLSCFGFVFIR